MDITATAHDNALVLAVTGRLDGLTANEFQERALEAAAQTTQVVLDLASLEYVSSAGLRSVLALGKDLGKRGGKLRLCNPQGVIKEVIDISGFAAIFPVHADAQEALAAVGA